MKLDTVTLEVIRNALPAVANEMAADLQRTSYNMMIYEVRDYCTALLDLKGELISQNVGGVSHFVADLGVLVICDPRVYSKSYGRKILASLPPMRRTRSAEEVEDFFRRPAPVRGHRPGRPLQRQDPDHGRADGGPRAGRDRPGP